MRGRPAEKLFTTMFSYMNQMQMLMAEETNRARLENTPEAWAKAIGSYMQIWIIPTVLQATMYALLRGDWDDKDKGEIATQIARQTLATPLGFFAVAREVYGPIQGFDYAGSAGTKPLRDLGELAQQTSQMKADEAFFKSMLKGIGAFVPIPSTAMWRLYQGFNGDSKDRPAWLVAMIGEPPPNK
jgi:hypothetical protein